LSIGLPFALMKNQQLCWDRANMKTSMIGLEACSGAHFLRRALRKQGRDVRVIAAQFVKPFVKSNKNDFVDAEAIAGLALVSSSRGR
jgi:transposase